ncbi:tetratricopeptide repeat protein [Streptomyces sp. NPDC059224]|uniref:tetratricopeptide repeat protein n=1 Tax=Streptomyces sp. NPDC059224 TaxID=3346775 RepID=UPI0036C9842D
MRVDTRVIALASGAVVVAVVLGFWTEAWIGAATGLGGLFAPVLWEAAVTRWNSREATAEHAESVFQPMVSHAATESITDLLRPENEVVPFRRRPESAELLQWCQTPQQQKVRLITGEGGAGKTRLTVQLGRDLVDAKWQTRWVRRGEEADAVRIASELRQSVLLVVDYAETRNGLLQLVRAAASVPDQPPLRILLLARSAGEWWEELLNSCDDSLSEALIASPPLTLEAMPASSSQEAFVDAVSAFAARLRLPPPDAVITDHEPKTVILALHAAALLAVVEQQGETDSTVTLGVGTDVFARLLRHEERYWHQTARARVLLLDASVERRAVALGTWIGANSETAAADLLRYVPDLVASPGLRGRAARWLRDLYPADSVGSTVGYPEWLGSLQPDRLAERLIGDLLANDPGPLQSMLTALESRRLLRALTIAVRAAQTDSRVITWLQEALAAFPHALIPPLITVAIETDPAVGSLIAQTVEEEEIDAATLLAFDSIIPGRTLALAEPAVVIARRIVHLTSPGTDQRAYRLISLGSRLSNAGHAAEAAAATTDAVTIFRRLEAERPQEFTYDLANSLMGLTGYLVHAGRSAEALTSVEEAVTLLRELADCDLSTYGHTFADALVNYGGALFFVGRAEDALPAFDEAVAIYRSLAVASPGDGAAEVGSDDMASALIFKSVCLGMLGRAEEALAVSEAAVTTYRRLAEGNADAFRSLLPAGLMIHAALLLGCGRLQDALWATEEAETACRSLAADRPAAFNKDLAEVLAVRALCLEALGRTAAAREVIDLVVDTCGRATTADAAVAIADISGMLAEHAEILERCGRPAEAEVARRTAATLADRSASEP